MAYKAEVVCGCRTSKFNIVLISAASSRVRKEQCPRQSYQENIGTPIDLPRFRKIPHRRKRCTLQFFGIGDRTIADREDASRHQEFGDLTACAAWDARRVIQHVP